MLCGLCTELGCICWAKPIRGIPLRSTWHSVQPDGERGIGFVRLVLLNTRRVALTTRSHERMVDPWPKENRFLTRAFELAHQSRCTHRHGAVLVRGGRIIAQATNRYRNDPANVPWEGCQVHAEEAVLRMAGERARGAAIYVARVTPGGRASLSKPCDRCQRALETAGVKKVYWT